jgi:hypothetical protein
MAIYQTYNSTMPFATQAARVFIAFPFSSIAVGIFAIFAFKYHKQWMYIVVSDSVYT